MIFDTMADIVPYRDENNANDVLDALKPLCNRLVQADAAVMFIHHMNKAGTARGSTAIAGNMDHLIELKRGDEDRQRTLTFNSRLLDIPSRMVVALTSDGYELVESVAAADSCPAGRKPLADDVKKSDEARQYKVMGAMVSLKIGVGDSVPISRLRKETCIKESILRDRIIPQMILGSYLKYADDSQKFIVRLR